jgi:hypothetical protein
MAYKLYMPSHIYIYIWRISYICLASSSDIFEARVCVTRLYDKTKGAQYTPIIEEDDEARVKLLLDKTKGAQYAPIIEDNNEAGGTAAHRVQYYLNN